MKKIIVMLLVVVLCMGLWACDKDNESGGDLGQLGADDTRYHCFEGVAIELKHKSTNEVISYKFDEGGHKLEEAIDLSQYECTRI